MIAENARPRNTPRISLLSRTVPAVLLLHTLSVCAAGEEPSKKEGPVSQPGERQSSQAPQPERESAEKAPRWFFLVAAVNTYPRLESEELVDKFFNRPLRILAPGFDDVRTFSDTRDDHLMWPPHLAVGRLLLNRWGLFLEVGYSSGKVRTKDTDASLLILPIHTDFEITRGALYGGVGLDYYPLGVVKLAKYDGLKTRLHAARPFLGTRLTWTHATYDAKIKAGLKPFGNLVDLRQSDSWLLPSLNLDIGADVPLTKRSVLTVNAGYTFFEDRAYDFAGPAYTIGWKYFFR